MIGKMVMMMMEMLLLLLRIARIIHQLLDRENTQMLPYFFLFNNSIGHLFKTGQLNRKLESRPSSVSDLRHQLIYGIHQPLLDLELSLRTEVPS